MMFGVLWYLTAFHYHSPVQTAKGSSKDEPFLFKHTIILYYTRAWKEKLRSIKGNYTEYSDIQDELDRVEIVAKETVKSLIED